MSHTIVYTPAGHQSYFWSNCLGEWGWVKGEQQAVLEAPSFEHWKGMCHVTMTHYMVVDELRKEKRAFRRIPKGKSKKPNPCPFEYAFLMCRLEGRQFSPL